MFTVAVPVELRCFLNKMTYSILRKLHITMSALASINRDRASLHRQCIPSSKHILDRTQTQCQNKKNGSNHKHFK